MVNAKFFDNQPVKRMRRVPGGILLTFYSADSGVPGEQRTISQDDWDTHGEVRSVKSNRAADMRKMIRT